MTEITLRDKVYQIPESFNLLKAKTAAQLVKLLLNQQTDQRDLTDYNFSYVSILLEEPIEYIENLTWEEFSNCLTQINTIMNKNFQVAEPEAEV